MGCFKSLEGCKMIIHHKTNIMKKNILYVSHDSADMKPISLKELTKLAFDSKTPEDYADYLNFVLKRATAAVKATGTPLKRFKFRIHENGAVHPFGEGTCHPYCKNFYTAYTVDADCSLIPRV